MLGESHKNKLLIKSAFFFIAFLAAIFEKIVIVKETVVVLSDPIFKDQGHVPINTGALEFLI